MTPRLMGRFLQVCAIVTASLVMPGAAQDREVDPAGAANPVVTKTNLSAPAKAKAKATQADSKASEQKEDSKALPSTPIQEILKMTEAGVSMEVIKGYAERVPTGYSPSAADIITLKKNGIPDDITMALLKRSTEVRAEASHANPSQASPVLTVRRDDRFYPDPEGYDYFQYYYLYPRTLASANERLGVYSGPFFSGYYNTFGPYSPRGLYFGNRRGLYGP